MIIRDENPNDIPAIFKLTTKAFEQVEYSNGSEASIIEKLRDDGDLALSLVAIDDLDNLIGHIAFSPVTIGTIDESWFGLGPVSVDIEKQKSGIGSKLIIEGLRQLKLTGAGGCILVGDPAYYSRFGFKNDDRISYSVIPSEFVQWLTLNGTPPAGEVTYRPAFDIA